VIPVSYVLPLRAHEVPSPEFTDYVNWLSSVVEVVLVDASPLPIYRAIDARCVATVRHLPPDEDLTRLLNGKVRGVLTGMRRASHDRVVVADDDVRYSEAELEAMLMALGAFDVVRPQNYFDPLPWHARLDTARTLINRVFGGDWPGTLGVRRSLLDRAGGYDGDVLFENLELVRTIEASGGRAISRPGLFVRRRPPSSHHFWSQRIRQAYDEFARPTRLVVALTLIPVAVVLAVQGRWSWIGGLFGVTPIALAELGRRRDGGHRVFSWTASLWAPLWTSERAVCAWAAVGFRVFLGGIPYGGGVLKRAATPPRRLAEQARRRRSASTGAL
jgi:hypothetical protein